MTCCFTGHRYFPWKDDTEHPQHKALLAKLEEAIDLALAKGAAHFHLWECDRRGYMGGGTGAEKEKSTSANFSGDRAALCRA